MSKVKYRVWDENCKINSNDKNICYFKLMNFEKDNLVLLTIVDEYGNPIKNKSILKIDGDYKCIILNSDIDDDGLIKTDFKGHAIIITEEEVKDYIKMKMSDEIGKRFLKDVSKDIEDQVRKNSTIQ